MAATPALKLVLLTCLAMVAFAANSVLSRIALVTAEADAMTYTGVRLAAGALTLALIMALRNDVPRWGRIGGSTKAALALFVYAIAFSFAYLALGAGTGALLLFAAVQFSMLGWAIKKGDRPGPFEWAGFGLAIFFLVWLVAPGVKAPDPLGASLMIVAGVAWAIYTLLGRGSSNPLADTGGNFLRCLPIALVLVLPQVVEPTTTLAGWLYAMASGALASGIGYAIWYSVLPALARSTAAYVQLTVPALAAAGGVIFIAEPVSLRLVLCSIGILGGTGLALWGADRRRRKG